MFWSAAENRRVLCELCPNCCRIAENSSGRCGIRENIGGELIASGYGVVSSVALDPIEKKPLYMFHPGKRILSIGGFGCSLRCPFCQNYEISLEYGGNSEFGIRNSEYSGNGTAFMNMGRHLLPEDVATLAVQTVADGNIGAAYTYNEPLIGYEFLCACAAAIRDAGLLNVLVTNGYINKEPLIALLPLVDAMNIDLKGFTDGFYRKVGGDLETVKETIRLAHSSCHVEVTTLVIPGENEDDIEPLSRWIASIDPEIPLHLSRFFPRYRYSDRVPTPRETILRLRETAKKHLSNVFAGNM